MKFVSIVMGSKSDYEVMKSCSDTFDAFGVNYEMIISSAHRSPERTANYIVEAEKKGAKVFIAAAGMAAHLAGVLSSKTVTYHRCAYVCISSWRYRCTSFNCTDASWNASCYCGNR